MKKVDLFIQYDNVLISFDFSKGNFKGYNLSVYTKLNCFSCLDYYLIVCDTTRELFYYNDFDSFSDLIKEIKNYFNFDISFIKG